MGVKIRKGINPLEASIINGCLNIYYFEDIVKTIPLPISKSITMGRQCNFYDNVFNNIILYLKSSKYIILIRIDGTLDIMTNDYIFLKRYKINPKDIIDEKMKVCFAGSLTMMHITSPCYIAISSYGIVFLFSQNMNSTILLDIKNDINKRIGDWALSHNDVGTLQISDNTTNGMALWANFGTTKYEVLSDFKVLSSDGVIGGLL